MKEYENILDSFVRVSQIWKYYNCIVYTITLDMEKANIFVEVIRENLAPIITLIIMRDALIAQWNRYDWTA